MWLIMRGALGDDGRRAAPLLPRARVEHRRRSPGPEGALTDVSGRTRAWRVAGAGAFGVKHLDALARIDDVEVVAVVSRTDRPGPRGRRHATARPSRHDRARRTCSSAATSTRSSCARRPSCTPPRRSPRCAPASTSRSRSRSPTAWRTRARSRASRARPASSHGRATPVASTRRTSGCTSASSRANSRSSRWTCRPTSFAAPTPTPWDSRAVGSTTCCGTTRRTRSTSSRTSAARPIVARQRARRAGPPRARASRWTCRSNSPRASGQLCTLSLSFNNDGPLGTFFRYICDTRHLPRALRRPRRRAATSPSTCRSVAVSMDGIELQDREFVRAIRERRRAQLLGRLRLGCYECSARSKVSSTPPGLSAVDAGA